MNSIIEGIKVLEQTPIKEPYLLPFWLLLMGGAFIAACGVFLWFKKNKPRKKLGICLYVSGILIMFSSVLPMNIINKETGRYVYKCTMDNSVPAKYISDNFKIISVEDDIWTIEDKER